MYELCSPMVMITKSIECIADHLIYTIVNDSYFTNGIFTLDSSMVGYILNDVYDELAYETMTSDRYVYKFMEVTPNDYYGTWISSILTTHYDEGKSIEVNLEDMDSYSITRYRAMKTILDTYQAFNGNTSPPKILSTIKTGDSTVISCMLKLYNISHTGMHISPLMNAGMNISPMLECEIHYDTVITNNKVSKIHIHHLDIKVGRK